MHSSATEHPSPARVQPRVANNIKLTCCLCKESACRYRKLAALTSTDARVSQTASSTANNTSAVAGPAAAAAHPTDQAMAHTGTPSIGTTASAPAASTSAKACQPVSNCSTLRPHLTTTTRRTPRPKTPAELSTARERDAVWGDAVVLAHDLDKPSACPQ